MSKLKLFLLVACIISFLNKGISQNEQGAKYVSDFNVLITSLKELHPILYKNISQAEFDKNVAAISARLLHTTSKYQAIYMIQELIYKIGNGHAGNISVYNGDLDVTKCLPFSVYILNNELYINDYPADTTYNGTKINAIEGTASKAIIDSLRIFFPTDGNRDVTCFFLQPFFNCYYSAFCRQKDTFMVDTQKGMIKAVAAQKGTALYDQFIVRKNWQEYMGNESSLRKTVTGDYGYFRSERLDSRKVEEMYCSLIRELNKKKIQNVIIDLRYNNGGDAMITSRMASYLTDKPFRPFESLYITRCRKPTYRKLMDNPSYFKFRNIRTVKKDSVRKVVRFDAALKKIQPNKEKFNGHVYVLTSSITLSASTMFCKYLEGQSNVSFVGTETSGAVNYFWASTICNITLPNLNTVFAFGVELIELKENSSKNELPAGLIPENKVNYTILDLLEKKDKEMDWIKADIKKRSGN